MSQSILSREGQLEKGFLKEMSEVLEEFSSRIYQLELVPGDKEPTLPGKFARYDFTAKSSVSCQREQRFRGEAGAGAGATGAAGDLDLRQAAIPLRLHLHLHLQALPTKASSSTQSVPDRTRDGRAQHGTDTCGANNNGNNMQPA
ncbi:Cyclin-dependent kinase 12 [Frankliniella fusca]|uniref:Cyclin-dependent kinase 12 n=1 Tax=Frankliniella fusca TaxID=407009 RepID=A0AAE1H8M0_9NEOP|nr:Cyclin-dependent kinase 12 [Frankliniella fusca]